MTAHFDSISGEALDVEQTLPLKSEPGLYKDVFKRVLDLTLVLLASPILLLLMALVSIPIILSGQSPIYMQRRIGRFGREFTIFKVKTMVSDSDRRLAEFLRENPEAREEWASKQKLSQDPRITAYGRFLRRTSLDELPQFLNVLLGDMSIIGPRPMMPHQRALYHGRAYFGLRPGISGLWQVSDRNEAEFVSRVHYDELYGRTLTFGLDLSVMLRTVQAVLRGTGC